VYSWAAPSYLTNLCVPVTTNTSRHYLRSAKHGDLQVPNNNNNNNNQDNVYGAVIMT